ncbi:hybrid sensor histidine kinase/response regulator [Oceanibaculum pacificum]|uniref:histidine kinase n=1 Tax=Oceanibaculum pacificum TaxID=580166 RepID=A0A154W2R7_9PROT|nr:hybrid sensor histidine kinase/response regulator [Oceanibaculum pacificum]KZD07844.1 hypothetical protein AUP43_09480 [Oceanibaculum pacificum]
MIPILSGVPEAAFRPVPSARRGFHQRYILTYAALLFVAITGLTFGIMELEKREVAIQDTYAVAHSVSAPLAANVELFLGTVDRSLQIAQQAIQDALQNNATDTLALHRALQDVQAHAIEPLQYAALDKDGTLLATSRTATPEILQLNDREYYHFHLNRTEDGLYIGNPIQIRLQSARGVWGIPLSRSLRTKDGALLGVISASVPLSLFKATFEHARLSEHGVVGIAKLDGRLLAAFQTNQMPAQTVADAIDIAADKPQGHQMTAPLPDGQRRLVSWKQVPDKEMIVFTAVTEKQALSLWRAQLLSGALVQGLIWLAVLASAFLLDRNRLRRDREEQTAREIIDAAFAAISDPLLIVDPDCNLTLANRAVRRFKADFKLPCKLYDAVPYLQSNGYDSLIMETKQAKEAMLRDVYFHELDQWFSLSIYPFSKGAVIYMLDVSEHKKTQDQLRQAQKMEMVGQLAGGIAHDFNNLLTVIIGNIDFILEDAAAQPRIAKTAELVLRAAERAGELTASLLAIGRRQALAPTPTDVNALLTDLHMIIRRVLPESIGIEVVPAQDAWRAEIDASQLETAILNLAINARDAMPEGGRLTLETMNHYIDADYAERHGEVTPGPYLLLAVSDTGHGMDLETKERAFDPFFTTKPEGKGTGLGLSMVQGFIKQTGGHIKIYSEPGQGTTIKLYLPRAEQAAVAPPAADDDPGIARGTETILVVEDDPLVQNHVAELVERLGYRLFTAGDADDAMQCLATHRIDLLLTDVTLPGGVNGRKLAERAQAHYPHLRVVFMSGYTRNAIIHHGRLDADVDFLPKPFRIGEMAQIIRRVLDRPAD